MVGPPTDGIRADATTDRMTGRDTQGVFAGQVFALIVFKFTPHAMQVDGVVHHGVVDQHEANGFAILDFYGCGIAVTDAIETPDVPIHVAGEMQFDAAIWFARADRAVNAAQITVGKYLATVVAQPGTRIAQAHRDLLCHHAHTDAVFGIRMPVQFQHAVLEIAVVQAGEIHGVLWRVPSPIHSAHGGLVLAAHVHVLHGLPFLVHSRHIHTRQDDFCTYHKNNRYIPVPGIPVTSVHPYLNLPQKTDGHQRIQCVTMQDPTGCLHLKCLFLKATTTMDQLFSDSVKNECLLANEEASEQKIRELLEKFDLEEYAEYHPMILSGGQRQRLAICQAVMGEKKLLIFDEPTSGLDFRHMCQVEKLMKQLNRLFLQLSIWLKEELVL